MKLALPEFQFRFVPRLGHVIHPGNFHPVGSQEGARRMVAAAAAAHGRAPTASGERWLVLGGSGGFGSAARVALAVRRGAATLNASFDAQPQPDSSNKIRKIGSPGFHRNLSIERELRGAGLVACTRNVDAFEPQARAEVIEAIREELGGPLTGLVWALAAPRGKDPRTGQQVASALRPLGRAARVKAFSGREGDEPPRVDFVDLEPGTPEEAISTIYVMGGGIVQTWIEALLAADLLAEGFQLLTVSYRGSDLNADVYRRGLIGLAKADLEFHTRALDHLLRERLGGRALAVEGPAVVTEASGGIPGVPFYMAVLMDVLGERFEDPLQSMMRLFSDRLGPEGPVTDAEGLVRLDDRELADDVQATMRARFDAATPGSEFPRAVYDAFMTAYARTRGFELPGVDYAAEFDTDEICAS